MFTYIIPRISFNSLGCWKDNSYNISTRAISKYEGELNGIIACYARAKALGNELFAVQFGKECWTSVEARETYQKYGPAKDCCSKDGTGGSDCQEVYEIGSAVNKICLI